MAKATCGPLEPFTLPLRQVWPAQRQAWWFAMNASGFVLAWGGLGTAALFVLVDTLAQSCDLSKVSKAQACDAATLGKTFGALANAATVPLGVINPAFGVAATAFAALCAGSAAIGESICKSTMLDAGKLIGAGLQFGDAAAQLGTGSPAVAADMAKVAEALSAFKLTGLPPVSSELSKFLPTWFAQNAGPKAPATVLPMAPPMSIQVGGTVPTVLSPKPTKPLPPKTGQPGDVGSGNALPVIALLGLLVKVFK